MSFALTAVVAVRMRLKCAISKLALYTPIKAGISREKVLRNIISLLNLICPKNRHVALCLREKKACCEVKRHSEEETT